MRLGVFLLMSWLVGNNALAQSTNWQGRIVSNGNGVPSASVYFPQLKKGTTTDTVGAFSFTGLPHGTYHLQISCTGYQRRTVHLSIDSTLSFTEFELLPSTTALDEVVVTGTMKEISRSESPVPVEILTPRLFQKNPTPSLFEAISIVNGVQPQLNCNVCNTGDIHINGMEGPYTLVLIDGMPIVSALSTVYGLNGIPNSMVERIEVVKGPASSLYGSEAMGGIINLITKNPQRAPRFSIDVFGTDWRELSADASIKAQIGKATTLLGVNYFNYSRPQDRNGDNFTDVTLQNRVSVFNKWSLSRPANRAASLGLRYVHEDRWGGELQWNEGWRGSDSVYGESIATRRTEVFGLYQLPAKEKIFTQFSYNWHFQDSYYGTTPYRATQQVGFAQTYWDKQLGNRHSLLLGAAFRFTRYDDNTPATASPNGQKNRPVETPLPGVFVQDEWSLGSRTKLLAGYRFDYDRNHGGVHSPRLALKYGAGRHTVRASFGSGFRVVNLFTEDHAALTGARDVVIAQALRPERSYNSNLNYIYQLTTSDLSARFDVTGFYSYFTNKIVGDFLSDPNKIIYDNLNGHAVSQGVSLNTEWQFSFPLKLLAGVSYMDVFQKEEDGSGQLLRQQQLHAPRWSGNVISTYSFTNDWSVDLTGKWNGPMRLPVLPNDFRPEYSPWHLIANIQLTKKWKRGLEAYCGIKNLFNFIPQHPILRPFDPFDKKAGDPVSNPNGYTFDPTYNYASLQGLRAFAGVRYTLR